MFVIRPAMEKDLDKVYTLSMGASDGLTTLPVSKDMIRERIRFSEQCFAAKVREPGAESYLLVLEDTDKGAIAGTTAVFAAVGVNRPFFNYEIKAERHACSDPEVETEVHALHFGTPYNGACELATLYLHPDYRFGGNGTLLSKSRYMLLASFPDRFSPRVMAEIRGWVDAKGRSPFWEAVGRHFFHMDLVAADRINSLGNYKFIQDLMPEHPIYIDMLPKAARDVIGKTHDESAAALKLLESEGLYFNNIVDVFDGGPCVEQQLPEIRAVKESAIAKVDIVPEGKGEGRFLIATTKLKGFRAIHGPILEKARGVIGLTKAQAAALEVRKGGKVRFVSLKRIRKEDGKK